MGQVEWRHGGIYGMREGRAHGSRMRGYMAGGGDHRGERKGLSSRGRGIDQGRGSRRTGGAKGKDEGLLPYYPLPSTGCSVPYGPLHLT